jgi:hypothetical protein
MTAGVIVGEGMCLPSEQWRNEKETSQAYLFLFQKNKFHFSNHIKIMNMAAKAHLLYMILSEDKGIDEKLRRSV